MKSASCLAALLLLLPVTTLAQGVTIDPGAPAGGASAGQGSASGAAQGGSGGVIQGSPQGNIILPQSEAGGPVQGGQGGEQGYYYSDGAGEPLVDADESGYTSTAPTQAPEVHVVRTGDTLWDICGFYFNNPWEWPRIWSYNEKIANPHYIYPGDAVRLYARGQAPKTDVAPKQLTIEPTRPTVRGRQQPTLKLRQLAFVSLEDLKMAGTISGSTAEKTLLSSGDEIYIDYPGGHPPQIRQRYAVYSPQKVVVHPTTGKEVGAYVLLKGEVQVLGVKKGKRARATVSYSTSVIERGDRVGNMLRQFRDVVPVAATRDLEGTIVASISTDNLIGQHQVVFLDRGKTHGLLVGNRLLVVRRGDAYTPNMGPADHVLHDDRRYPDHALAQITIVETSERTSVGVVNHALQEVELGDHVVMRKNQ